MSENLTVKTAVSEDCADERRNLPEYQLNNVAWFMRSGVLYFGLIKKNRMNMTHII